MPAAARSNARLYAEGKRYRKHFAGLRGARPGRAVLYAAAAALGVTPEDVRHAVAFARAVDSIHVGCGAAARRLILDGHPRLPPRVVVKISRTHPDRQRSALARARAGRDPLGKPPPGTDPPFDTLGYGEVLGRLARNAGALAAAADGLLDAPGARWPAMEQLEAMRALAAGIRRDVRAMKARLPRAGGAAPRGGGPSGDSPRPRRGGGRPLAPGRALALVPAAAAITAKNARDLPRLLAEAPPNVVEKQSLLARLRRLDAEAARLAAVLGARGHDPRSGPSAVPGTYVVLYRLPEAAAGLRVGALGTFDFPPGYYAYLGSAFGGGVRGRTHRHLTRDTARRWNVDWLKPLCIPVAVWWTHDPRRVEFAWADALAALPGASFPAPGFGAADNRKARAHLVRFDRVPSVAAFRRRVKRRTEGHAPVHAKRVVNWTGRGWPG